VTTVSIPYLTLHDIRKTEVIYILSL